MILQEALAEIRRFRVSDEPFPFGPANHRAQLARIEQEFGRSLPTALREYVLQAAPAEDVYFDTPGNALCIYGIERLKFRQDGYNYNPADDSVIEDWPDHFFILADEGADPVFIDLDEPETGLQRFFHGLGEWDAGEVLGDTVGDFLLCAAAQHHALNDFEEEPIVDDDEGFNLAPHAAKWYFKNMEVWAGEYYSEWCSIFDNS